MPLQQHYKGSTENTKSLQGQNLIAKDAKNNNKFSAKTRLRKLQNVFFLNYVEDKRNARIGLLFFCYTYCKVKNIILRISGISCFPFSFSSQIFIVCDIYFAS